jgi:hypothetical protein
MGAVLEDFGDAPHDVLVGLLEERLVPVLPRIVDDHVLEEGLHVAADGAIVHAQLG